jgi:hypothetical protein
MFRVVLPVVAQAAVSSLPGASSSAILAEMGAAMSVRFMCM